LSTGTAELPLTSGADSDPTVPTGAAVLVEVEEDDDEDVEPVEDCTVSGQRDVWLSVLIDGNGLELDDEEEDVDTVGVVGEVVGIGSVVGGALTVVVWVGALVDDDGGEVLGGAVCAQAPEVVVRRNTPAKAFRDTSPSRDLVFDGLRIIAGDP